MEPKLRENLEKFMTNKPPKVPKFYYRPDLNTLESVEDPSPHRPTVRTAKKPEEEI